MIATSVVCNNSLEIWINYESEKENLENKIAKNLIGRYDIAIFCSNLILRSKHATELHAS